MDSWNQYFLHHNNGKFHLFEVKMLIFELFANLLFNNNNVITSSSNQQPTALMFNYLWLLVCVKTHVTILSSVKIFLNVS